MNIYSNTSCVLYGFCQWEREEETKTSIYEMLKTKKSHGSKLKLTLYGNTSNS